MTLLELNTFNEIALLIGLATALGIIGMVLRQPMIVAFIAAGLLAGPDVLNIVRSTEAVSLLSQISIAVLLFLVGLKLDTGLVRSLGGWRWLPVSGRSRSRLRSAFCCAWSWGSTG